MTYSLTRDLREHQDFASGTPGVLYATLKDVTVAVLRPAVLFGILKDAAMAFNQDRAPRLAAAIAYYAMFSIAPILFLAVVLIGSFLSDSSFIEKVFSETGTLVQTIGPQAAQALRDMIPSEEVINKSNTVASIIGFGTLFMGATGLFVQLQDALNSMWGADNPPSPGVVGMVKTRIISFVMILSIGVLLLGFLALNTYLSAIARDLGDQIGVGAIAVRILTFILSTMFLAPVFAAIYKFLPSVKLEWKEVNIGGALTALLFTLGQLIIGTYLGRTSGSSALGAAGTLLAILTWIYYSAMIFFFGAEVTWVYSQRNGSKAGGAGNNAKKEALVAQGMRLAPDQPESDQTEKTKPDHSDTTKTTSKDMASTVTAPPQTLPLPSIGAALWNIVSAIFALPAIIVLKLLRIFRRK